MFSIGLLILFIWMSGFWWEVISWSLVYVRTCMQIQIYTPSPLLISSNLLHKQNRRGSNRANIWDEEARKNPKKFHFRFDIVDVCLATADVYILIFHQPNTYIDERSYLMHFLMVIIRPATFGSTILSTEKSMRETKTRAKENSWRVNWLDFPQSHIYYTTAQQQRE